MQVVWKRSTSRKLLQLLAILSIAVIIFFLFFWRLGNLTRGLSQPEVKSRQSSHSFRAAIDNGVDLPFYIIQRSAVKVFKESPASLRAASAAYALIIILALLVLLRNLFGPTIAMTAGLIIATTPWLVLTARNGTPWIMYFWPLVPAAIFSSMARSKNRPGLWWIVFCSTLAIAVYTPGMLWFLVLALIFGWAGIIRVMQRCHIFSLTAGVIFFLALLSPLGRAIYREPLIYKQLLLIPATFPNWLETLKSIGWSIAGMFWRLRWHVDTALGRLPILNIMQITLVFFGFYALSARLSRLTYLLVAATLLAAVLSGISNNPAILSVALIPFGIFIASGLRYLLLEWQRVFPRNPIARVLAVVLIFGLMSMQVVYGIRYSLAAWPNSQPVKKSYVLK